MAGVITLGKLHIPIPTPSMTPRGHGAPLQAEMPVLVPGHCGGETHTTGTLAGGVDRAGECPQRCHVCTRGMQIYACYIYM